MTIDQKVYSPGDFAYYDVPDMKCEYQNNKIHSASWLILFICLLTPNSSAGCHLHRTLVDKPRGSTNDVWQSIFAAFRNISRHHTKVLGARIVQKRSARSHAIEPLEQQVLRDERKRLLQIEAGRLHGQGYFCL